MQEEEGMVPIDKVLKDIQQKNTDGHSHGESKDHIQPKTTGVPLGGEGQSEDDQCPICRGAHFVHPTQENGRPNYSRVVPCKCVKKQLEKEKMLRLLRLCELPVKTEHMTFDNFEVGPGLEEAYQMAREFADGSADFNWLTFISDTNRGKTHLGIAIVRHWLSQQKPARYAYVPLLFEELKRGFRAEGDRSYEARFDFFLNVPLLMLDDIGTEKQTAWVQEKLDTIVDYRLMNNLPLVVTTNSTLDEIHFRIASRLQRNGRIVIIDAPEHENREGRSRE